MQRVLIVGAGPTGLLLALCLMRYGIAFDIVEAKSRPCLDSKALAISPMSLLQLELLGYADEIGRGALRVTRANISWQGKRLNPVDLKWLDYPGAFFLTQPQSVTEQELADALRDAGGRIARSTEVIGLKTSGELIDVVLRAGGVDEHRSYAYVVGCDGKRSVVRQLVGAEMRGSEYPMHLVLGDFELAWDRDPEQAHYFLSDDTFFVFVPVPPGRWRVVVKHDGPPPPGPPRVEAILEPVQRHFGPDLVQSDAYWLSQAQLYHQVATRLATGRAFIAGDAAHLFSPIGGTGMNTGMQDAANLGWKLAFEILGRAKPGTLLGSYENERLEAINATAVATDALTRLIAGVDSSPERVAMFFPRLASRRLLKQFPIAQSGLGLRYSGSSALPVPGSRRVGTVSLALPAVMRALGADAYHAPPLHLLVHADDAAAAARLAKAVRPFGSAVRVVRVALTDVVGAARTSVIETPLCKLEPDDFRRLGLGKGTALGVRPDGIIFHEGPLTECAALERHLASLLTADSPAEIEINRSNAI